MVLQAVKQIADSCFDISHESFAGTNIHFGESRFDGEEKWLEKRTETLDKNVKVYYYKNKIRT